MRRLAALTTSLFLTSALAGAALVAPANAAPEGAEAVPATTHAKKAKGLKLKRSAAGSHWGMPGVKITAVSKKKKGKITFKFAGQSIKKKLKKGKAKFRLPSDLAPGTYRVKAKVKGGPKASTKVEVYNSSLALSATQFTISASTDCYTGGYPPLTGSVLFKGSHPSTGYVDIYRNGNIKGGSSSPDYITMTGLGEGGQFTFSCSLWNSIAELGVGTHQFKALYTPTASFSEYIYSDWIVVTVVP